MKKMSGCIEKRGPNSYRVGFQIRGESGAYEWIRKTIHTDPELSPAKQRKQAEDALMRLRTEYGDGKVSAPTAHTVRSFSKLWMTQHVIPNASPTTAKGYRSFLDTRILPILGDVRLDRLTPVMLTEWINTVRTSPRRSTLQPDAHHRPSDLRKHSTEEKRSSPISDRTVQHYYDTLYNMLQIAVQWNVIAVNPMDRVTRPKASKSKVSFLSEEQAMQLLDALADEPNPCYRVAVLLALLCGLRLGEVGALRFDDIDWEEKTIDITAALKYTPDTGNFIAGTKTDAGRRLIALPETMVEQLRALQADADHWRDVLPGVWQDSGYIVHTWDGRRISHDTPSKWFRRFADAHGFEGLRFHDLRHTHATLLLANGIDAVAVANRLGHTNATTTLRIYAHALRRRDTDAANALDNLFHKTASDRGPAPDQPQASDRGPAPDQPQASDRSPAPDRGQK